MKALACISLISLLVLSSGCTTSEAIKVVPIAGGRTAHVVLTAKGPQWAEDERMVVELSAVLPIKQTGKFSHTFIIKRKKALEIKRVRITEVTTDPETLVMDTQDIKYTKDGYWSEYSEPLKANDPKLAWVNHQSNTMLMYRVRVTWEDGKTSEVISPFMVSPGIKYGLKKDLGL